MIISGRTKGTFRLAPKNIWYELSFVRPFALPVWAGIVDESRLIFGSSAPRNDPRFELRAFDRFLSIREHPGVYGANLLALLGEQE